jgi:hypothetical protein
MSSSRGEAFSFTSARKPPSEQLPLLLREPIDTDRRNCALLTNGTAVWYKNQLSPMGAESGDNSGRLCRQGAMDLKMMNTAQAAQAAWATSVIRE